MSERVRFLLSSVFLVLILSGPLSLRADLATIYLKGGEARTVELVGADRGQIQWKNSASAREVQSTLRSQVDYVVFPTTPEWREAEELRESGRFAEAIPAYQRVVAMPAEHFYPFPGNYTTLAIERLLQCHRNLMDVPSIARQAGAVREEFSNLPPEYRQVDPVNMAWVALSEQKWDVMLAEAGKADPPTPESFFLKGRALEELGKKAEAIQAFAGVYTLNFGGNLLLTRSALERSAILLSQLGIPEREVELIAQLKLYRDLFGGGKLWEGASEKLNQLADGEIMTLGEPEGEMAEAPASSGGTVVEESGSMVAAPGAESRDYVLPQELSPKAVVITGKKNAAEPELKDGAAKSDAGYLFDGTGGGFHLNPVDASLPIVQIRLRFTPENTDAALLEMNEGRGGGVGIYLVGGKLSLIWAPKGKPRNMQTIGDVAVGKPATLDFRAIRRQEGGGNLSVNLNGQVTNLPLDSVGLNLSKSLTASVGDAVRSEGDPTLDGKKHPPFEGTMEHVSIGTGENLAEITDKEIAQFGKRLLLSVPASE